MYKQLGGGDEEDDESSGNDDRPKSKRRRVGPNSPCAADKSSQRAPELLESLHHVDMNSDWARCLGGWSMPSWRRQRCLNRPTHIDCLWPWLV